MKILRKFWDEMDKMDDALWKAAEPFNEATHKEIQIRLNKLNKLVPIHSIFMGMAGWSIKHPLYKVICKDDNEPYYIELDDLEKWSCGREDVPKPILKLVDELRELLDFIDDQSHLMPKDFYPEN
jgi:hypothetical protein